MVMEKTFLPSSVEARITEKWTVTGAFQASRPDRQHAEPYAVMLPPPNVTGSLHIGHALNVTLQDVICRFQRMRGKDVFWQVGTDHAGIATQMLVERKLEAEGLPKRETLGREAFLAHVWNWKDKHGGTILQQLKHLGASCDWSRERFTMDDHALTAVRKVFIDLYKEGLIYKDKRLVNWDPHLGTALSDLEVQARPVKGSLWRIRYALKDNPSRFICIATTRPETLLGDTAIAVHPQDPRYRDLIGQNVIVPLVGRVIPIIADDLADMEKGTGAVKITPAHDFNDFEVGRRHQLPFIALFSDQAHVDIESNDAFWKGVDRQSVHPLIEKLQGLNRTDARRQIVSALEEGGLLDGVDVHENLVPHGDRSGVVLEPKLTDQWYLNVKPLAQKALTAFQDLKEPEFFPESWAKVYRDWLEGIQPWCLSRQLWWGHQIPAWYGPDGHIFVATDAEAAAQEAAMHYGENTPLVQDKDVLDTWFSSALWPFLTLGWPHATPELSRYYPTALLVTGFDILFFWVARMTMMGIHLTGKIPFKKVWIHALVRDAQGAKMSKTKGNTIDPMALMATYGADALRLTLASLATPGRDIKLAPQRVESYRNFATKLWNSARFAEMNGCLPDADYDPQSVKQTLNLWILHECAHVFEDVTQDLDSLLVHKAAISLYRFVWNVFCDWYIELAKPLLSHENEDIKKETQGTLSFVLDRLLSVFHPFMPFLTEEIWTARAPLERADKALTLTDWPLMTLSDSGSAQKEVNWVIELISQVRSLRAEIGVPSGARPALTLVHASPEIVNRTKVWGNAIERLGSVSEIMYNDQAPYGSVSFVVDESVAALSLEGWVDMASARQRLLDEQKRVQTVIRDTEMKLADTQFINRAHEDVIETFRTRRDEAVQRDALLTRIISCFSYDKEETVPEDQSER
jgi:valyl-tRNA synthetase